MGETQVTGSFNIAIPTADGAVEHVLHTGDTLFVVGANGSGKSGLVSMLFNAHSRWVRLFFVDGFFAYL